MILINDDFSGFVYLDDAEMQAMNEAMKRAADAFKEAIEQMADAIKQLIGCTVEQLLDDLPPLPEPPKWQRAPAILPGGTFESMMEARRYIPP